MSLAGLGSSTRLFQLIARKPQIPVDQGLQPDDELVGDISLSNVQFSYPTRPDIQIFSNLNLQVMPGNMAIHVVLGKVRN